MKYSEELLKQSDIIPTLRLTRKEGNSTVSTGPHKVKLISDKADIRLNARTNKEEKIIWFFVEENGVKLKYAVPQFGADGEVHYLIQRLGLLKSGTEVILEYKKMKGSYKGYIDVQIVSDGQNEIVDYDETPQQDANDNNLKDLDDEIFDTVT